MTAWSEIRDSGGRQHSVSDDGYNDWEGSASDVSGRAPVVVIHSLFLASLAESVCFLK